MSIQFLGNKVFKNRAKVDVWIRTKQSSLNVPSIQGSKQPYVVEEKFEQVSLFVQQ